MHDNRDRYSLIKPSVFPEADLIVRGILIVAIVLGHNRLLTTHSSWFFGFVYKWHVHGFFFLALASRGLRSRSSRIADVLVRFLVPFFMFLTLGTAAIAMRGEFSLNAYLQAAAIGSARLINAACDISLFWFLPAFAGYLLFVGGVGQFLARRRVPLAWLSAICVACLIITYLLPKSVALFVPLGIPIVLYIFPGAVLFGAFNQRIERFGIKLRILSAFTCLIVFSLGLFYTYRDHLDISLFKYGQGTVIVFIAGIVVSVSASLLLKAVALSMPKSALSLILAAIGKASLVIFLVHSFIQAPLVKGVQSLLPQSANAVNLAAALAISSISVAAGFWVDALLRRLPNLRELLLPHDRNAYVSVLDRIRRDPRSIIRRS
ncbi:acyltransferase family protein [Sphingomonas faeni]|uniref:acyltransferase family protein n=1 Tax=Sphingomonas faeni TaxID=185950 RepID=UPI00278414C7|nr:acyltransferase family protein [Sphingomonas faeni]MDQ0838831.1 fucose 4-O-acetylase-like acetyltransferase [Sphingomonas faeni]